MAFSTYSHQLKNYSRQVKKRIQHHEELSKLFQTKNARLITILVIAAAIPLTVLGVQTVQDIRQSARGTKAACDGASTGLLVQPQPANKGEKIVFKHESGLPPITEETFQEQDFLGNGVDQSSCKRVGETIECNAKGSGSKTKPSSFHTWKFRELAECEYEVKWVDATGPKPSKNPTVPPGKTATPKPSGGNCTVSIKAADCTVNNTPRLQASWDLQNATKPCKVVLKKDGKEWEVASDCNRKDAFNIDKLSDGSALESGQTYTIDVFKENKSCKTATAKTATCAGANTPTQKVGNGTPTATPKAGTPTPTKVPGTTQLMVPTLKNHTCTDAGTAVNIQWNTNGNLGASYKVIYTESGKAAKTTAITTGSRIDISPVTPKVEYKYKIIATQGSNSVESIQGNFKCDVKTPTPKPGTPTPTKGTDTPGAGIITPPFSGNNCPGGPCP